MAEVDNALLYEVLKDLQDRMTRMENHQREGFASLRDHIAALHSDTTITQRRLGDVEIDVDRLKRATGMNTDDEASE